MQLHNSTDWSYNAHVAKRKTVKSKTKKSISARGRRIYKNPPITEAVCEFQFANPVNWTIAHSSSFFERVKKRYNGATSEQRILQLNPSSQASGVSPQLQEITKVQLKSDDGREMVSVGPGILGVHSLKPYSGWEQFRSRIAEALRVYCRIASAKTIRRIGIRYINQIFIPSGKGKLGDYFTTPPYCIPDIKSTIESFATRYEYVLEGSLSRALVQLVSINNDAADSYGVALDIDVSQNWQDQMCKVEGAQKIVDQMRAQERDVFEAIITDKARGLFNA